jgi:hypothetical protein
MNAGTYGHHLLDIYYAQRRRGLSLNDAAATAFQYDPDKETCQCGCNYRDHKRIELLNIEECQHCKINKRCIHFVPRPFELDLSTRQAVQTRVREYFFTYQHNDFQSIAEEVGFSEIIFEDDSNLFVLEGRIDLIATLQGLDCIVDHKFQMRQHQLYQKSVQFRNYALVCKKLLLIINYIRLHKAVGKETLVRELVNFTVPELLAWKQKLIGIFFRVKSALTLAPALEQNSSACPGRFNYKCSYIALCDEPNPEVALRKQQQLYRINENPWRPW